jgi:hypothetical protein
MNYLLLLIVDRSIFISPAHNGDCPTTCYAHKNSTGKKRWQRAHVKSQTGIQYPWIAKLTQEMSALDALDTCII